MKILLPVDGSENSIRAVKYAADIAKNIKESSFTLVYVDNLRSLVLNIAGRAGDTYNVESLLDEKMETALKEAENILSSNEIPFDKEYLEHDDPAEAICDYAEKNGFNQIIMGTRGYGNIQGIIMGSVSHKVLYLASCPVTFVK
ncbi:MAG: universal stress protein [bacterium]